jgi:hypothetical protein
MTISSRKFVATLAVAPDQNTVLVHCDIDLQKNIFGIRTGLHHGWLPGQHVFVTIPSMGFKHRFQAHPFTIASPAPPKDRVGNTWPLHLVIRSIDGFSLDLLNYARHHQHCEVILDGPHGGAEAVEGASLADRVCFIAGGSGIAVTYPLAWRHQIDEYKEGEALLDKRTVYRNGKKHVPEMHEVTPIERTTRYGHFWVRQDPRHAQWISIVPRADAFRHQDTRLVLGTHDGRDDVEHMRSLVTRTFDTRQPGTDGGRPDMKSEIFDWVTSPISTELSSTGSTSSPDFTKRQEERICLIISGPDGLVRDVRNVAAQLLKDGWNIQVYVEKFGW